MRGDQKVLGQT